MHPGDVIADRFEIQGPAGTGGMGVVYRALDRMTGDLVALKLLHAHSEHDTERFLREADALAALREPGIVRYVDRGTTAAGAPWLVMEWLEGETLSQRLRSGRLGIAESITVASRVALALSAVHRRGIVHRDLKPGNLMLVERSVERLTLIDFGIARLPRATQLTQTGAMIGTPGYMAPEQARGEREIDARADVFSLGCVLFRCLTGRAAFEGDDALAVLLKLVLEEPPRLKELRPDVPPALDDLVARMLAKSPGDRPRDADAVAREIASIDAIPIDASPAAALPIEAHELTSAELKVMCLIVARAHRDAGTTTLSSEQRASHARKLEAVVERYEGRLDRLADHSLLVTLTATGTATDLAAQAARCALALGPLLEGTPIAVVSGRAVVSERFPVGDLIARAIALVEPGDRAAEIVVDTVTAGLLGTRFELNEGPCGRRLRREQGALEAVRTLLGRPTICVGRERDLALLEATFTRCTEEAVPSVVLVIADAGMGKSRLCYEFVHKLQTLAAPVEIWVARSDPMSAGSAFGLLGEAIRNTAGIQAGEPLEARQKKLRARVARHVLASDVPHVTEFLGELAGVPFSDEVGVQLWAARRDARLMGDQMRRAWEDFLAAETLVQPVLLVLEDLQWGDLPTIKLIGSALRALEERPFMVVAMGRSEVHQIFPDLWKDRDLYELRLSALSRKASERLIRQVLGPAVTGDRIAQMVGGAGGNAFYLEELIRAADSGSDALVPETVLAMVEARLERFEPEARRLLRAASIFGQTFWRGGLATLLGGPVLSSTMVEWLAVLEARELIALSKSSRFPDEPEYVFRQALFREAAYAMLTDADRALGHMLAGSWLEQMGERDAVLLAEHLERGRVYSSAARWYRQAAEDALDGDDLEAVVGRANQGLRCIAAEEESGSRARPTVIEGPALGAAAKARPDASLVTSQSGAFYLLITEAHRWRGKLADAEQASLEAMATLPVGSSRWYRAASEAVLAGGRLGHIDRMVEVAQQLRAQEPSEADAADAKIVALARANAELLTAGRYDTADVFLQAIDALLENHGQQNPAVIARAEDARARRALILGDLGAFLQLATRALRGFLQVSNLRMACSLQVSVGYAQLQLGAYAEAARTLAEALATAERLGLGGLSPSAQENLGQALAGLGRWDEAEALTRKAVAAFSAQGNGRMELGGRIYLALMLAASGELARAEDEARAALAIVPPPPLCAYALAALAQVLLAQQRVDDALVAAREAIGLLDSLGTIEEGEALLRLVFAEALFAAGDPGAVAAIVDARGRLLARAAKIGDATMRASFLERVPENARTLSLASLWQAEAMG